MPQSQHIPIMVPEIIEGLHLAPGDMVLDATVGGGGHAQAMLEAIAPQGRLLGIDWDAAAAERAKQKLAQYKDRAFVTVGNYTNARKLSYESGFHSFSAILLDLGVSRDQLKDGSRGFGIQTEGSLDMRFSDQVGLTAADIVNTWSEDDLAYIFKAYGEERHAARVARHIVTSRKLVPITSVRQLRDVVMRGVGTRGRTRIHPATRVFQALRIATNSEFENIQNGLPALIRLLRPAGRLAVITFHSLEDRIVKYLFRDFAKSADASIALVNKKVITPAREEQLANPASRSAKLRIIEAL